MSANRSQDFAVVALVISVVAHIGTMLYMRPQVMAEVVSPAQRVRHRGPMKMTDRPPEPESIHLDVISDVEALKDAPDPVAETPAPTSADFAEVSDAPDSAAPKFDVSDLPLPIPAIETAPEFSERFKIETEEDAFFSPLADGIAGGSTQASLAEIASAPDEAPPDAPDDSVAIFSAPIVPDFTPPPMPAAESPIEAFAQAPADFGEDPRQAAPKPAFKPVEEVMPTVDETIVEAEKAAVRDLLDVRNAEMLEKYVATSADSAQEGDWTYFRVRFTPGPELVTAQKDLVVLLDASGSIGKDRLESCRNAARRILRSATNSGDRFNLVAFRDKFSYCFNTWAQCDKESFERADRWLGRLAAHGRTDVFATIRSVLTLPRDPTRPLIAMVVTDGDANAGISETAQILSQFTALNDGLVSVYMYGVKETANRELLDVLTHGNRGESFIYGGSRWKAGSQIDALSERFRDPVLTDLRIVFAAASADAEIFPRRLKNLYKGETVDFVGRVKTGTRTVAFSLKGLNGTKPFEGFFTIPLADAAFDAKLPEQWREERAIDAKLGTGTAAAGTAAAGAAATGTASGGVAAP